MATSNGRLLRTVRAKRRIAEAAEDINAALGIEDFPAEVPKHKALDLEHKFMLELEGLADWLSKVAMKVGQKSAPAEVSEVDQIPF